MSTAKESLPTGSIGAALRARLRAGWRHSGLSHQVLSWLLFGAMVAVVTAVVVGTGGAPNALMSLYYLPILYVAALHGTRGAVIAGLVVGIAGGPWMISSVPGMSNQPVRDWVVRLVFFTLVGVVASALSRSQPRSLDVWARDLVVGRALRSAVRNGRVNVHYQPLIDLTDGDVVGFESLCRWSDNAGQPVSPAEFIPQAERSGAIIAVGRSVLDQAVGQAMRWAAEGRRDLMVTVNVSGVQLSDPTFLADVKRVMGDDAGIGFQLCLEITETAIIADPVRALETLTAVRAMGVTIALDDFGTGQSSLEYLASFPIDIIKIDRAFVSALGADPKSHALVRAMVHMAHSLGAITIAEGIETSEQLRVLGSLGCAMGQGYHLGRPSEAADAQWMTRDVVGH